VNPYSEIIAIDGPAASGKSTIGEKLAEILGYMYFDTGVMYRAVALAALRKFNSVSDEDAVSELAGKIQIDAQPSTKNDGRKHDVILDGEDVTWSIRSQEVDANVSQVSAYPVVRREMTAQQRRIGKRGKLVVVGRDIGTVVFPEAGLKIYMDAPVEERARRRYEETRQRGMEASREEILKSMRRRDQIDSTRSVAPLYPAEDAHILDSEGLSIGEVLDKVSNLVRGGKDV